MIVVLLQSWERQWPQVLWYSLEFLRAAEHRLWHRQLRYVFVIRSRTKMARDLNSALYVQRSSGKRTRVTSWCPSGWLSMMGLPRLRSHIEFPSQTYPSRQLNLWGLQLGQSSNQCVQVQRSINSSQKDDPARKALHHAELEPLQAIFIR